MCICTSWFAAVLTDSDGTVLDMKVVSFSTMEGCVYCPAGQCDCDVSSHVQFPIMSLWFGSLICPASVARSTEI